MSYAPASRFLQVLDFLESLGAYLGRKAGCTNSDFNAFHTAARDFMNNDPISYMQHKVKCNKTLLNLAFVRHEKTSAFFVKSVLGGCYIMRCEHLKLVGEISSTFFAADNTYGPVCYRSRQVHTVTVQKLECPACFRNIPLSAPVTRERFKNCRYLSYLLKPGRAYKLAPYENFGLLSAPRITMPIQHCEDVEELPTITPVIPCFDLTGDQEPHIPCIKLELRNN